MEKKASRQNRIRSALDGDPALRVGQLAYLLGVSTETIRRDLHELEQAGALKRTYGGAIRNQVAEPALAERMKLMIPERQAIALAAVNLIGEAESLLVGSGATCLHFAMALRGISRNLVAITPCYSVAAELAANPLIQVMVLPGNFDGREGLAHGPDTLEAIQRYSVPIAILGASGVDEIGVSEAMPSAAQVFSVMIRHASRSLILADRSKFNLRCLTSVTAWRHNICLVTDTKPGPRLAAAIHGGKTEVVVAPPLATREAT